MSKTESYSQRAFMSSEHNVNSTIPKGGCISIVTIEGHLLSVGLEEKVRGSFLEEGTLELSYNIYVGAKQVSEFSRKDKKDIFKAEGTARAKARK